MKRLLVNLIHVYRHTIGLVLPPSCRFTPSCSSYAAHAIETHGIIKGLLMSGWRLLRCNPWCSGGFDPVPRPQHWKHAFTDSGKCKAGGYE